MSELTVDALEAEIGKILNGKTLEDLSLKKVRKELEVVFDRPLKQHKGSIQKIVSRLLVETATESSSSSSAKKKKKKKKKTPKKRTKSNGGDNDADGEEKQPWGPTYFLDADLAKVCGLKPGKDEVTRSQIVKKVWEYIRKHDLQCEANKREIECDALLKKVFDGNDRVTMFNMNKFYGAHLEKTGNVLKRKKSASTGTKKKKKRRRNASSTTNNMPLCTLSADLSAVCGGETELPRTGVVKKVWEYIKAKDLQNPEDRREILCDDALKKIFDNETSVTMFSLNKYLSKHLTTKTKKEK